MSARKTKQPARTIQYLLSLDRRLQKVSLRKIVEQVKTPKSRARSKSNSKRGPSPAAASGAALPVARIDPRTLVFGVVCVVAAVALIGARQPTYSANGARGDESAAANAESTVSPNAMKVAVPVAPTPPSPRPSLELAPKAVLVESRPKAIPAEPTPKAIPVEPTPKAIPVETTRTPTVPASSTSLPAIASSSSANNQDAALATITGCLDRNGDAFVLRDVAGADAPKARSWRSGFLKKSSRSVVLVDEAQRLALEARIGQRVEATGVLDNRELRARSLLVEGPCD